MPEPLDLVDLPFVILRHELPPNATTRSHWDLMFATQPGDPEQRFLETWSTEQNPFETLFGCDGYLERLVKLPDHRLHYLLYEGPVANDRGEVKRLLSGRITHREISSGQRVYRIHSSQLTGQLQLSVETQEFPCWRATWTTW